MTDFNVTFETDESFDVTFAQGAGPTETFGVDNFTVGFTQDPFSVEFNQQGVQGAKGDVRIPLFDDTYDGYVEGDVVRDAADVTFINTFDRATPTGTELTDTTYWNPVSNVSGEVIEAAVEEYLSTNPVVPIWTNVAHAEGALVYLFNGRDQGFDIFRANKAIAAGGTSPTHDHADWDLFVSALDYTDGTDTFEIIGLRTNASHTGLEIVVRNDEGQHGTANIRLQPLIGTGTPEAPTTGSNNPTTSGQVFTALQGRVSNDVVADTYVEGTTADTDLLQVRALKELIAAEGGNTSLSAYSATKEYSLGNIVYTLNSGVAHVYIYINETASTGMNPETPANNTHWDAMGVDEVTAVQSGSNVEVHLARADALLHNPNAGMAVAIENENVGHSSLLNWEASNGVLVLNVDGLVDALANTGSSIDQWATATDYVVGDIVLTVYNNVITSLWHCHTAHTSDNTGGGAGDGQPRPGVDNNNWDEVAETGVLPWTTGFNYQTGNVVFYANGINAGLYQRKVGGSDVSNAEAPDVNHGDWRFLGTQRFGTSADWEAQPGITMDREDYVTTSPSYSATQANIDLLAAGYSDGDRFFIISRDTDYQVISTGGNLALQFILTSRDSIAALGDGQATLDRLTFAEEHAQENATAISALQQEIGKSFEGVDEQALTLRHALRETTTRTGGQSDPANLTSSDPEYVFGAGHVLIWYVTLDADDFTIANQLQALQDAVTDGLEIAVSTAAISDSNVNAASTYHFAMQSVSFVGTNRYMLRAVLVDPTKNDAFRTAFALVGTDPLGYQDRIHFSTQNVIFDHIEVLVRTAVINAGVDTALRDTPATVADDTAWLAYINGLGITGGDYDDADAQAALNISNTASTITYRDAAGVQRTFNPSAGTNALTDEQAEILVELAAINESTNNTKIVGIDASGNFVATDAGIASVSAGSIEAVASDIADDTFTIPQITNLQETIDTVTPDIAVFSSTSDYIPGENFIFDGALYLVLIPGGQYADVATMVTAGAAELQSSFTQVVNNNTFTENVPGSFVDDSSATQVLSNIQVNNNNLVISNAANTAQLTASLFTNTKARGAVTASSINLAADSQVDGVNIATDTDISTATTEANTNARLAYFSGLGPFVGGLRDTGVLAAATLLKTNLTVPGSTTTFAYYFAADKTWRETDSATGTILGRFGG